VVELGSKAPVGAFVDGAGQLRVAWTEIADRNIGTPQYYVQSWPGSGAIWNGLGSTLGAVDNPTQTLESQMSLARDASGNPAIAFGQGVFGSPGVNVVGVSLFVP